VIIITPLTQTIKGCIISRINPINIKANKRYYKKVLREMTSVQLETEQAHADQEAIPIVEAAGDNAAISSVAPPESVDPRMYNFSAEPQLDASRHDLVNDEAPLTMAAQARAIEWALQDLAHETGNGSIPGPVLQRTLDKTHNIAYLSLLANVSRINPNELGTTVVGPKGNFLNVDGPAETPTGFDDSGINLSPDEVRTVREDYAHIDTDLPETQVGSGAEILENYSPEELDVVLDALKSVRKVPPVGNDDLFTHKDLHDNEARLYFGREAEVILDAAGYEEGKSSPWTRIREAARSLGRSVVVGAYATALIAKIGRS
jgi:hypothetical protein